MSLFDGIALQIDKPFRQVLLRPDGTAWKDKDGNHAYIDVMSSYSEKNVEVQRYIAAQREGGRTFDDGTDTLTREVAPMYVTGWYLLDLHGEPLGVEWSLDNARALFADHRCDYITATVREAIVKNANFMPAQKLN